MGEVCGFLSSLPVWREESWMYMTASARQQVEASDVTEAERREFAFHIHAAKSLLPLIKLRVPHVDITAQVPHVDITAQVPHVDITAQVPDDPPDADMDT